MIDTKQIRRGNILQLRTKEIRTVTHIKPNLIVFEGKGNISKRPNELDYLPLTEELLAHYNVNEVILEKSFFCINGLEFIAERDEFNKLQALVLISRQIGFDDSILYDLISVPIRYFHHLQNLVLDLTSMELKLQGC